VKVIRLTQKQFALVDDDKFDNLIHWKWTYDASNGYAVRNDKGRRVYMHRQIMNLGSDQEADHINRNKLDNRVSNLRVCTSGQNKANRRLQTNSTTGYKGVSQIKGMKLRKPYAAYIKSGGRKFHIGLFATKEEAAQAYDKKAVDIFGEYAVINFPKTYV